MDALKILSRSTSLAAKKRKAPAAQHTPSDGQRPNPQIYGQDAPLAKVIGPVQTSSKKRKRGQDTKTYIDAVPTELDFFNSGKTATATHEVIEDSPEESNGASAVVTPHHAVQIPQLDHDQCKQLLKSHKIKVSQLWTPPSIDAIAEKKRKKRKDQEAAGAAASDKKNKQKSDLIVQPLTVFSHLRPRYGVASAIAENLQEQGYSTPTEIQLGALPLLLGASLATAKEETNGYDEQSDMPEPGLDVDLLSVAPTGSGKTLAFLIPVLAALLEQRRVYRLHSKEETPFTGPKAIIIAPTKELASQITNEGRKLSQRTGVKVTLVKKGMNIIGGDNDEGDEADPEDDAEVEDQSESDSGPKSTKMRSLKKLPATKADILVSTPMTLLHAITSPAGVVSPLDSVRYVVLDEADVLLDPLFRDQTLKIWSACTNPLLRVSLWSATMGSSIEDLAMSTIASRFEEVQANHPDATRAPLLRLVVGLKDSSLPTISHKLVYCATEQGKLMALRNLLRPSAATLKEDSSSLRPPFLIFTQTIPRAIALHSELLYDIPAEAGGSTRIAVLHADLTDTARENIMTRFRRGEVWVLITTDLLSRGVDFRGLNGVVNYDFPSSSAVYVHRVGRTGRAGREGGVAVTLYAKEDVPFVKNVANVIAASEKLKKGEKLPGQGLQQWLLDALPKPTKREKQELKQRGVASRNINGGEGSAKSRISTKSGYERQVENRKKGAVEGAKRRKMAELEEGRSAVEAADTDAFGGFDD
jgi:ATP-dependent RNA helicase DDX52/ROK1